VDAPVRLNADRPRRPQPLLTLCLMTSYHLQTSSITCSGTVMEPIGAQTTPDVFDLVCA
jgi:hypothetical protein